MPPHIPRACRKQGCAKTTTERNGYCEEHQNLGWETHQRGKSRHQRGYGTQWDKLRARILKRDKYLCQECLRSGRATEAKTVDHIIAKAHGVPMMIVTCKACAGPVIELRQQRKE